MTLTPLPTIKKLREARRWTQADLAQRIGVTPTTVANWEHWRSKPRVEELRDLAAAVGVRMDGIALTPHDHLVTVGDHSFVVTANQPVDDGAWVARATAWACVKTVECTFRSINAHTDGTPSVIVTDEWSASADTPEEALSMLADGIARTLDEAHEAADLPERTVAHEPN